MNIQRISICIFLLLVLTSASALSPWIENLDHADKQAQLDLRWTAYGGEVDFQFFYGMLDDLQIEIPTSPQNNKDDWPNNHLIMNIKSLGGLELQVPFGQLEAVTQGRLHLNGSLSFSFQGNRVDLTQLTIRPSVSDIPQGELTILDVIDSSNNVVFKLDHIHTVIDKENKQLLLKNMDLRATPWFANQLGNPYIANKVIAQAHIASDLNIPQNAYTDDELARGLSCVDRPLWPTKGVDADVQLIALSAQWSRNLSANRIVITPSARLKNVGTADVAWYTKFSGTFPPYSNDQHPFLSWSMYREIDNRFEQIGRSGMKHAFLTINVSCTINCGSNNILWPGCEDVYGVGTNDNGTHLGTTQEVDSFLGLWENTGSFFDPGNSGSQTNSSNATDENRMVIEESQIGDAGDDYYISGWYTIRDDVNIFNTMGFVKYNLNDTGTSWSLSPTTSLANGPASDAYVAPNTIDMISMAASQRALYNDEGNITVAVKVIDLGGDLFRYNYMVENHDYDPQIDQYSVPLLDAFQVSDFVFSDLDVIASNNWTISHASNVLTINGNAGNQQDWGMLFSFSFTANVAPTQGTINLRGVDTLVTNIGVSPLFVPGITLENTVFANSFE